VGVGPEGWLRLWQKIRAVPAWVWRLLAVKLAVILVVVLALLLLWPNHPKTVVSPPVSLPPVSSPPMVAPPASPLQPLPEPTPDVAAPSASVAPSAPPLAETPVFEAFEAEPPPPPVMPPAVGPSAVGPSAVGQDRPRHAHPTGKPGRIALVIDDVGLRPAHLADLLALPTPLTLSFLPYAPGVQGQVDRARANGNQIFLHLPMEPMGHDNPGPDALLTTLPPEEITRRVEKNLSAFTGYVGVNNHMGSKFTSTPQAMALVLPGLKARGVIFLDSRTYSKTVAEKMARDAGIPTLGRDVFLDDKIDRAAILRQLELTENIAARKGSAIAIGHPHPETLEILRTWIPAAKARGVVFVPAGALVGE
jgi:uncharacterized protein